MFLDGMYILVDFISYLMEMFFGKYNGEKVFLCEKDFNRFLDIYLEISDNEKEQFKKKRKLDLNFKFDVIFFFMVFIKGIDKDSR